MQFLSYLFGLLLQFPDPSFLAAGDTGDTGDSGDTEETETPEDTSTDSADSATDTDCEGDSGCDEVALTSAMELAGENGGFGCAAIGTGSAIALWGSVLVIGMRRED